MDKDREYLEDIVIEIRDKVDMILKYLTAGKRLHVTDLARQIGVCRQTLYTTKRYMLPGFGNPIPKGGWTLEQVYNWMSYGPEKLYSAWKRGEELPY